MRAKTAFQLERRPGEKKCRFSWDRNRATLEVALGTALMVLALGLTATWDSVLGQGELTPAMAEERTGSQGGAPPSTAPQPAIALPQAAPRIASYDLEATLEAAAHIVQGRGTIRWVNASRVPVSELWFHLYLNAFRDGRTLFLRRPETHARSQRPPGEPGHIEVRSLRAKELPGVELWRAAATHSPDDPEDATDIRVPLPRAIEPGGALTLEVTFESKLPRIVERAGYEGTFHLVAQWFPKLARLEPDGTWAHFAYHPHSEFYADFGRYRVTLDVPETLVVGATGRRTLDQTRGGRRVVRHEADGVHDFAWTAWDGFQEQVQTIDGVEVRLLYPREAAFEAARTWSALKAALPHFNRAYGHYPYGVLTVVHPPPSARAAGGMEYPTLITTGSPRHSARFTRVVELVTTHELAHQWFYGMVATNEHAAPVLDEGLTSYAEAVAMEALFGPASAASVPGLRVSATAVRRALAAAHAHDDTIAQPADHFSHFESIGGLVYARTATALETLARVYGEAKVNAALGTYARRYRFAHPGLEDLLAAVAEHVGQQAEGNLRSVLLERGWVDYRVSDLGCSPPSAEAHMASYACRALVRRLGDLALPVDVDVILEDGTRYRESHSGRERWWWVRFSGRQRVSAVAVDPEHRITLDQDLLNNEATRVRADAPRVRTLLTYGAELLLGWLGP